MNYSEKANLQVNTELDALANVLAWFEQFDRPTVPRVVWQQCQLALAEGFTNAVRHAHKNRPRDTVIELEVLWQDDQIELKIWDFGESFDFHNALASHSSSVDLTAEGGRGLKLMHQLADSLDYVRTEDGRNCLIITKRYARTTAP